MKQIIHYKMKAVSLLIIIMLLSGCGSLKSVSDSEVDGDSIELSFIGKKMDNKSIRELKKSVANGDGEAAHRLYAYYLFAGNNPRLSKHYYERALELEYPATLYDKALKIWSQQENPDITVVYKLMTRALELGYKDDQGLKEEVDRALESGVIPAESRLRWFPELR